MKLSGVPNMASHENLIDTLRITESQRQSILEALNRRSKAYQSRDMRIDDRLPYQDHLLIVELHHPGGSCGKYRVQPVNISSNGLAMLHGSFCYTGTPAIAYLKQTDGRIMLVKGKIVRCHLIEGRVHEIGILFHEPIQLSDFLEDLQPKEEATPDNDPLPRFRGRVLYLEDFLDNRELMAFMTDMLGVELTTVETCEQLVELLSEKNFDLVIADLELDDMPGSQIVKAITDSGYTGPIVGATTKSADAIGTLAEETQCNAILPLPFRTLQIAELFSEFLLHDNSADTSQPPLISEEWSNIKMRPVILDFLQRLNGHIHELEQLFSQEDFDALSKLCGQLKGTAGGYGYPQISEIAGSLMEFCEPGCDVGLVKGQLNELIDLCSSASRAG